MKPCDEHLEGQQNRFLLGGYSRIGKTNYLDWYTPQQLPIGEWTHNSVPVIKVDVPEISPKELQKRIFVFITGFTAQEGLLTTLK